MARWAGTTTARGLGSTHQKARTAALTALRDGDLCARCQQRGISHPMYRALVTWTGGKPRSSVLDLDDFPGRIYGGPQVKRLSYRKCNRGAGATLGNQLRGSRRGSTQGTTPAPSVPAAPLRTSRQW